jgi:cytochrome bd-type quinol oxidase subunit 2
MKQLQFLSELFQPLYRGLVAHPLLLLASLFFLAIAWGLGRHYGVQALFWHDSAWTQFLNGLAVALLLAQLCFVAYLRDLELPWLGMSAAEGPAEAIKAPAGEKAAGESTDNVATHQPYWRNLRWYLGITWAPLLLVLCLAALQDLERRWPLLLGVGVAVLLVLGVGLVLVIFYPGNVAAIPPPARPLDPNADPLGAKLNWVVMILFTLLFICYGLAFLLFTYLPEWKTGWPGRALVLASLVLVLFLVLVGIGKSYLRFQTTGAAQEWRHQMAGIIFLTVLLGYASIAVLSAYSESVERWVWTFVPPVVALCLFVHIAVIVDNTIRWHFEDAILPAWAALIGLGVLASSYEHRRLHFPALDYTNLVRPADLDLNSEGTDGQGRLNALHLQCDHLSQRLHGLYPEVQPPAPPPEEADAKHWLAYHLQLIQLLEGQENAKLEKWKKQAAPEGAKAPKLVVVAVVGGANRAALWTTLVLTRLEESQELPNFARHVRVITGASGGMVGACYYVATLSKRADPKGPKKPGLSATDLQDHIGRDHLTPVFHRTFFRDLPLTFWPFQYEGDRGMALEEAWRLNLDGALDVTFDQLHKDEKEGRCPSLVLTPMLVEDGRQLIISNLFLQSLTENAGNFLRGDPSKGLARPQALTKAQDTTAAQPDGAYRYSLSALELFQLFPDAWSTFQLGTGARMNASFPYVSPAVDLPTSPRRRVVDAGYYDNYGIKTATAWIYHHKEWLEKNTSGVVLIQVRDLASERRRLFPAGQASDENSWGWYRGIEWLTGPLVGASSARESVMSFRNDEQVETLSDLFNASKGKDFFTTVVFSFGEEIALNWYLGQAGNDRVKGDWNEGRNQEALKALEKWWRQ